MAEKMSAAEALSLKRNRKVSNRKKLFMLLFILLAITVVVVIITSIQVNKNSREEKAKAIVSQIDVTSTYKQAEFLETGDWDNDGIFNSGEDQGGTKIQNEDTDGDGISDGDEKQLGTDPLEPDTDKDGMLDGYELMSGTDPMKKSSDGFVEDSQRKVTIERTFEEVTATISGSPNVADLTLEELNLMSINTNSGILSKAYDIYSDFSFDKLSLSFKIDKAKLDKLGAKIDDVTVLRFNSEEHSYEKISSTPNSSSSTVSADIDKLGIYLVGVERIANAEPSTRVAFLIDNSGSMYAEYTGYDVDFKRIDFANDLIGRLQGDYSFLIAKFTADYTKLQDFTSDKSKLESALASIRTRKENFNGTHSQSALEKCIAEFTEDRSKNYRDMIVFLTDGESDEQNPKSLEELQKLASDKGITIMTVGLGREIDRGWLQKLASKTNGKYYSAADADSLSDVYKQIETSFNFDIISYNNNDDTIEGYSLYNTGFKPDVNGFSFRNFRTTSSSGVDFGMAVLARDWYLGNVKTKLSAFKPDDQSRLKYDAIGYDMSGTKLEETYNKREPLSKLITTAFSGDYGDAKNYIDFSGDDTTLKVKEDILSIAEAAGWKAMTFPISGNGLEWDKVELLSLDVAGSLDKIKRTYSDWEGELFAALHTLNALQWNDARSEFNLTGGDEGFERLKNLLAQGIPVVTTIDDSHTVNAIGLIQDSTAHRKYILQVYDSSYPGKTKEIYITRAPIALCKVSSGKAQVTSTAFEYSTTYEGKQVGLSFSDVQY